MAVLAASFAVLALSLPHVRPPRMVLRLRSSWQYADPYPPLHQTSYASLRRVRQAPSTPDIPGTKYEFLGCFTSVFATSAVGLHSPSYSDQGARTLGGATFVNTTGMTVESCVSFCSSQNFNFAGLEFAQECCAYN